MRHRIAFLAVALAVCTGAALGQGTRSAIRVAQSAALTGLQAEIGVAFNVGAQAAFAAANRSGGVHGRPLELASTDDGYDVRRTVDNTQATLAQREDPLALFGYTGSPGTAAAAGLAQKHKIVLLAPVSGSDALQLKANPYVFFVRGTYSDEINRIVEQLATIGVRKAAVFYQDDDFGRGGLAVAREALAHHKFDPAALAAYNPQKADVSSAAKAILDSGVQAVVHISSARFSALLLQSLAQARPNHLYHYGVSIVSASHLVQAAGALAHGFVVAQRVPNPAGAGSTAAAFRKALREEKRDAYLDSFAAMEGFIAAQVLMTAVKSLSAGRMDRASLRNALEQMPPQTYDAMTVAYSPQRHRGSTYVDFFMVRRDGTVSR